MHSAIGQRYGEPMSRPRTSFEVISSSYDMSLDGIGHNRSASNQQVPQHIRSPNNPQQSFWSTSGGSGSIDQASYFSQSRACHPPLLSIPQSSSPHRLSQSGRPSQYTTYPVSHSSSEYRFSNGHANSTPRHFQGATDWGDSLTWAQAQDTSMLSSEPRMWSDMSSLWPEIDAVQPSTPASPGQNLSPFDAPYRFSSPSSCSSPYSSAPHSPKMQQQASRPLSPLSVVTPSQSPTRQNCVSSGTNNPDGIKMCTHCKATSTPLWRRDPQTLKQLCNACGLYLQQRHKLRPQELIDADAEDDEEEDMPADWTGNECTHCHTRNTSVWRRSKDGEQLCNACGVYKRLRGKDRPLELKRNRIKPRSKHNIK